MELNNEMTERDVLMVLVINKLARIARDSDEVIDDPEAAYMQGYYKGFTEARAINKIDVKGIMDK